MPARRNIKTVAWEATAPITDTGHFGEIWFHQDGKIVTGQAQPQLWRHALFYLSALEVYGVKPGSELNNKH